MDSLCPARLLAELMFFIHVEKLQKVVCPISKFLLIKKTLSVAHEAPKLAALRVKPWL